ARLRRILGDAAVTVVEEARGAPALLLERIGAVVALIEARHQAFALSAVDAEVEDLRDERRKPAGKTLRIVGHPSDDSGRGQGGDEPERERVRAAPEKRRRRL